MAGGAPADPGSGGLPQFDLGQWPGEMVWLTIIFALLLAMFYFVFTPRVGGAIAAREDKIGGDIGAARRLRDEAEAQSKAAAEELAQARARAQTLAADAKSAAVAEAVRAQAAEEARVGQLLANAEGRIAAAKAAAMGEVRIIAADAALAIVEKLTGQAATGLEVEQALAGAS